MKPNAGPLSNPRPRPGIPRVFGALFFGLFALVGTATLYFLLVRPLAGILSARSWRETPCVILKSELESHRGDDSTTYKVAITYQYEVGGRKHISSRYDFQGMASNTGLERKRAAVKAHPPGRRAVCFVNPSDPDDAVIERGVTGDLWWGLFPLPFLLVGVGGLYFTFRRRNPAPVAAARPGTAAVAPSGSTTLKQGQSRGCGFAVISVFALVWNGIVSVFVVQALSGNAGCWLKLFLVPFVLVGLGLIGAALYTLLGLFNPRALLTLDPSTVPLGGAFDLTWRLVGKTRKLRRLRITLEGREEATYRRGTDTVTDKETFAVIPVLETDQESEMAGGTSIVVVPADTMHSFQSVSNRIAWSIHVRGEIPRWPDVADEYPVKVRPPAPEADAP
jgi:hypothetical protein